MTSNSKLTRDSDGKVFIVVFLSHWSEIVSEDGEKFSVKWFWTNGKHDHKYISHDGVGFTFDSTPMKDEQNA